MKPGMHANHEAMSAKHYRGLLLMALLSFGAMYCLMFAMADRFANVYPNLNQLYMAALMTAPMVIIELVIMGAMYTNKRLNFVLLAVSVVIGFGAWTAIRQQAGISDRQFAKSMIPHHAGAILMCEQASLTDPALKTLCSSIISGQKAEIELMKARLKEPGN